jgi:hypothetical protein
MRGNGGDDERIPCKCARVVVHVDGDWTVDDGGGGDDVLFLRLSDSGCGVSTARLAGGGRGSECVLFFAKLAPSYDNNPSVIRIMIHGARLLLLLLWTWTYLLQDARVEQSPNNECLRLSLPIAIFPPCDDLNTVGPWKRGNEHRHHQWGSCSKRLMANWRRDCLLRPRRQTLQHPAR